MLRRTKQYLAIFLVTGGVAIGSSLTLYDSHHVDLPYLLWKNDLYSSYRFKFKYLNIDKKFRQSLNGKSKEELLRYFPDAYPVNQSNAHQKPYMTSFKTADALWLGETNWGAEILNNNVQKIVLMKG